MFSKHFIPLSDPTSASNTYKESWNDSINDTGQVECKPNEGRSDNRISANKRIKTDPHLTVSSDSLDENIIKQDESAINDVSVDLSFSQKRVMDAIMSRKSVFFSGESE